MTWWRRNWLDVLMVALVIAVIVGFLALIFRNNLPRLFGGGATVVVTEEATPPAATSPGANDAATATASEETAPQPSEEASANDAAAGAASDASAASESAATTAPDETPTEAVTEAPTQAEETAPLVEAAPAETTGAEAPASEDAAAAAAPVTGEASAPESNPDASVAPAEMATTGAQEAGPSTGPASRAEYRASYRVAIATFKDAARAERLAEKVRASGESKTWAVDTGDSAVVLVGPFTDEADARAALERVKANYPDAILYRPSKASANPAQASVQASPVSTATQEPQVTSAEGSVTLQLGAFKDPGSADKLIASLDGTGYHVTVRSSPDGLTRVLLGPLTPSERAKAEAALRERGINPFPSR